MVAMEKFTKLYNNFELFAICPSSFINLAIRVNTKWFDYKVIRKGYVCT